MKNIWPSRISLVCFDFKKPVPENRKSESPFRFFYSVFLWLPEGSNSPNKGQKGQQT